MDLQFYGANCIRVTTKKASIVIDDNLVELGEKKVAKPGEIQLFTTVPTDQPLDAKLVIDAPGEYEASDVSIQGITARSHMDEAGKHSATMFKIVAGDVRLAVVGHVYPDLNSDQLEALGTIDVLVIPVGGFGYTLDSVGALKLIRSIEPKVVVPTHYADKDLKYEVPQASLDDAIKGLSMEVAETTPKLKLKAGIFPETAQLVILEKS